MSNQDTLATFLLWLRKNGWAKTESVLFEEMQDADSEMDIQVVAENDIHQRDEKLKDHKSEQLVCEGPGDFEEENVIDFEARLTEQLKRIARELTPEIKEHETKSPENNSNIDSWEGPDDPGFVRVPAQPGDEAFEICDDDEHQRELQHLLSVDEGAFSPAATSHPSPGASSPIHPAALVQASPSVQQGENYSPSLSSDASGKEVIYAADIPLPASPVSIGGENSASLHQMSLDPPSNQRRRAYEAFDLKIIYQPRRTGFEEHKDFPIRMYDIIAGRYQILEYLGSAAFSRAVQCVDLKNGQLVCVKIIRNNKDFFDQGLDEIKLLHYINSAGDPDENCVLQLYDYFYYKEHLFLVCELLRDNLYEFCKYNRESGDELYFTFARLQKISQQILTALKFIHSLSLLHCDLKPENILIKSYSRCEVKVIDFGSSCFITDHLSSYVQSRCYRAPEVVLGLPYSYSIDIWSLGAILAELYSGRVLFQNESLPTMMARIVAICGPFPDHLLRRARHANRYFTRHGVMYERGKDGELTFLHPKSTTLQTRLGTDDPEFLDFVGSMLSLDPARRPTAEAALRHPFMLKDYGPLNAS